MYHCLEMNGNTGGQRSKVALYCGRVSCIHDEGREVIFFVMKWCLLACPGRLEDSRVKLVLCFGLAEESSAWTERITHIFGWGGGDVEVRWEYRWTHIWCCSVRISCCIEDGAFQGLRTTRREVRCDICFTSALFKDDRGQGSGGNVVFSPSLGDWIVLLSVSVAGLTYAGRWDTWWVLNGGR